MKFYLILVLFLMLNLFDLKSQDSTYFTLRQAERNEDFDLFLKSENVEINRYDFNELKIKNKFFIVNVNEYHNGKLIKTIIPTDFPTEKQNLAQIDTLTQNFEMTVLTKPISNDSILILITLPGFETFIRAKAFDDNHSFLNFIIPKPLDDKYKIPINEKITLAVISPPFVLDKNGTSSYCLLRNAEFSTKTWWEVFKIKNYFSIQIQISDSYK